MEINPCRPCKYLFFILFLLLHCREFTGCLFFRCLLGRFLIINRSPTTFFALSFLLYCTSTFFYLFNCLSCNRLDLKSEIDLHYILDSFMWLCNKHIEEKDSQKSTALLVRKLEAALLCGKRELKDRLKHEWRHQMIEKFSWLVHLVAATYY